MAKKQPKKKLPEGVFNPGKDKMPEDVFEGEVISWKDKILAALKDIAGAIHSRKAPDIKIEVPKRGTINVDLKVIRDKDGFIDRVEMREV